MKNRKKEIILLVIAILVIVSMIAGATYAFFKAQTGPAANFDINATTSTTDNLTFSTEGDIVLNVTADNLKKSGNDLSDTAIAKARLIKSNSSESATAYYNIYLLIEENEMEYSSYTKEGQPNLIFMNKEEKDKENLEGYKGVPELVLSVKKNINEYTITKRLTPIDGGYDITEADGLYAIGEDVKITSTSDVTDTWEVKVTFKNLNYNQQLNTGRSLKGKIIITAEKLLYEINDAAGLRKLSEEVNDGDTKEGKYYVLTNNIDLGEHQEGESNFTPIGTNANRFKGNFNGDNHTISNLYINNTTNDTIGLFGYGSNITISNLTIKGNIASSIGNVGGFIGTILGISTIDNCRNEINISNDSDKYNAGGVVGISNGTLNLNSVNNYGKIVDGYSVSGIVGLNLGKIICNDISNNGEIINNKGKYTGGIIGYSDSNSEIVITNSVNNGNIYHRPIIKNSQDIGGFIGATYGVSYLKNCFNMGNVIADQQQYVDANFGIHIGGLIGLISHSVGNTQSVITESYNSGMVSGGDRTGGLVGCANYSEKRDVLVINKSYNIGTIKTNDTLFNYVTVVLGGLVGWDNCGVFVINSYNTGTIKNTLDPETVINITKTDVRIGGILGITTDVSTRKKSNIVNSYNVGNIIGESISAGFVGDIEYAGLFINNAYNLGQFNATKKYGIFYGNINTIIVNTYYDNAIPATTTKETGMNKDDMKSQSFVETLNGNIINETTLKNGDNGETITLEEIDLVLKDYKLVNWKLGNDGYPTLDF